MRLDLHLHSTASDGACPPEAVVRMAVEGRLDVVALADHDTTAGVRAARAAARKLPLHIVPALEVSSTWRGHDIHVLGYFVEPGTDVLDAHERRARRIREERMKGMIDRLAGMGVDVSYESVLEAAGPDRHTLGRPHLARALEAEGHVGSVREAFDRYIGDDGPAFIPTEVQGPGAAVELILDAGGVPVWAHPPEEVLDALLPTLVDRGLRGLEVFRPRNRASTVDRLRGAARRHGLVVSGGSDWHGHDRGPDLGDFYVTAEEVSELLQEGGM